MKRTLDHFKKINKENLATHHRMPWCGGGRSLTGTSFTMILPFWWIVLLLTMLTIATPKLQRIPKEMQKPSPLRMAMMYLRGSPKQVQSHSGAFRSGSSRGLPSSVSSITSPVCCRFSSLLHRKPIIQQDKAFLFLSSFGCLLQMHFFPENLVFSGFFLKTTFFLIGKETNPVKGF